jgi:hypothetical protein
MPLVTKAVAVEVVQLPIIIITPEAITADLEL